MSEFELYFTLGFEHISDLGGYDHILFVIALAAVYSIQQWKHMLVLVTAFTIGHSITLALATTGFLVLPERLIETLIPITIAITAILNVFERFSRDPDKRVKQDWRFKYGLALFFGLIHGMGFSYYLRALLGGEENVVWPLFSFNVELEMDQLVILVITLMLSASLVWVINQILTRLNRPIDQTHSNLSVLMSVVIAVWALTLI